ncbi:40S ribosomal protein S2-1 [Platanthera guangdongensis]|uniref:40S ribosomal protein S2-1 n=1 Tax=Platanthera guangdongensis TaxID=2320717 RepID=A0ABR2MDB7_9ASPA
MSFPGTSDCGGHTRPPTEGRKYEDHARAKADQSRARTRFKAFVVVGDGNGHVGLGVKCSKEVATAIRGAIILAKLSVLPVRRGYWGNKSGSRTLFPAKSPKMCSAVTVRMVPAPEVLGLWLLECRRRFSNLQGSRMFSPLQGIHQDSWQLCEGARNGKAVCSVLARVVAGQRKYGGAETAIA